MIAGATGYVPRTWTDSPATVEIVERFDARSGSSAVSYESITSNEYVVTVNRIEELTHEVDEEDRPSPYAHGLALRVLAETARELTLKFPRASVSVGPSRSLRITWASGALSARYFIN